MYALQNVFNFSLFFSCFSVYVLICDGIFKNKKENRKNITSRHFSYFHIYCGIFSLRPAGKVQLNAKLQCYITNIIPK